MVISFLYNLFLVDSSCRDLQDTKGFKRRNINTMLKNLKLATNNDKILTIGKLFSDQFLAPAFFCKFVSLTLEQLIYTQVTAYVGKGGGSEEK